MAVARLKGDPKIGITGMRKRIFPDGDTMKEKVHKLVQQLVEVERFKFYKNVDINSLMAMAPIGVSGGRGVKDKETWHLIEDLAKAAGAAIGSSRPAAETLKYVPVQRYVGMSGQKFKGNLYFAIGISGAIQHLKGIKDASRIIAINKSKKAPIFSHCDYGIVGDLEEVVPLLIEELNALSKEELTFPYPKIKKAPVPRPSRIGPRYVFLGCGYKYVPEEGNKDADIPPETLFEHLDAEFTCPDCGEAKDRFIKLTFRNN